MIKKLAAFLFIFIFTLSLCGENTFLSPDRCLLSPKTKVKSDKKGKKIIIPMAVFKSLPLPLKATVMTMAVAGAISCGDSNSSPTGTDGGNKPDTTIVNPDTGDGGRNDGTAGTPGTDTAAADSGAAGSDSPPGDTNTAGTDGNPPDTTQDADGGADNNTDTVPNAGDGGIPNADTGDAGSVNTDGTIPPTPPVITPISDISGYLGDLIQFTIQVSSTNTEDLELNANLPDGSSLRGGSTPGEFVFSWQTNASTAHSTTITFRANVGDTFSEPEQVTINLDDPPVENVAPTIAAIPAISVVRGETADFTVTVNDGNPGDTLNLTSSKSGVEIARSSSNPRQFRVQYQTGGEIPGRVNPESIAP